jgi:hypothetical protein
LSTIVEFNIDGRLEGRSISGVHNYVLPISNLAKSTPSIGPKNSLTEDSNLDTSPKHIHNNHEALAVAVVNCRSLKNKIPEFHHLIHNTGCNIIIGTESWLTDDISDSEIFPKSFNVYRKDRSNRTGGGVFIAVKKTIVSQAEIVPDTSIESVWCSIRCPKTKTIFVCAYYRPPNSDVTSILELETQIRSITSRNTERNLIIGGDFNTPSIDWRTYSYISGGRDKDICESLL